MKQEQKDWIKKFFLHSKELNSIHDIYPYYSKLSDVLIERDFVSYDNILEEIKIKELNPLLMLSLLRLSFMYKEEIKNWEIFLSKSKEELELRGLNSQRLLQGLL